MSSNPKPKGRMAAATAGADAVEIKVTVTDRKEGAAASEFKLDPRAAEQRRIYFFDTPKLELFNKGVILRAREVKGCKDDSTVKIRPVDPRKVAAKWLGLDGFKIEA